MNETNNLVNYDMKINDIAIVIPSYEPELELVSYVHCLVESGFVHIIVVDDGSGESFKSIFDSIRNNASVITYEKNRGKGYALKTGYRWIRDNLLHIKGIITADSDGQHTVEDCLKLSKNIENGALLLGTRDFNLPNIPPKSRSGNKITSLLFKLLYGQYLPDTQTGLRAFSSDLLDFMIEVPGDRYEYEMNVLIACAQEKIPMLTIPIQTVYENNNEGTHFHPIRDSWKIYKVLLGKSLKFMSSSLISMVFDQGIFNFLNIVVFHNGDLKRGEIIFVSTIVARVISAIINFTLNRNFVFNKNNDIRKSFGKYIALCIFIMIMSASITWGLSILGINSTIAKIIADTILYFVSYRVQENWVFSKTKKTNIL